MKIAGLIAGCWIAGLSIPTHTDCLGVAFGSSATLRGRVAAVEWGAPVAAPRCRDGKARCFERALATAGAPTHVRLVMIDATHREPRGELAMKRVVLEGILPRHGGECAPAIAVGQLRALVVEPRAMAPWRITGTL